MPHHLLLQGSTLWVLNGFFDPPEKGLPELTKRGAATIEVSDFLLTEELLELIANQRLGLIIQAYPEAPDDLDQTLNLAKQTNAVAVNLHVRQPHIDHDAAVALVKGLYQRANDAGVKLFCETHRGCVTQDLYRTARLVEAVPEMRLTLDISHYVICEEQPGPTSKLAGLLDGLLDRVEMIHGRISNGQQIQEHTVDPDGELAMLYQKSWSEAMRRWRLRNPAGSSLIFTPELGPPPYAVVGPDGNELSNRMDQSEIIWKVAQAAWKDSASSQRIGCWP